MLRLTLVLSLLLAAAGARADSIVTGDLPRQAELGFSTRPVERGLEVVGLRAGTPAERAGMHDGDVIVAVDGSRFDKPTSARISYVASTEVKK